MAPTRSMTFAFVMFSRSSTIGASLRSGQNSSRASAAASNSPAFSICLATSQHNFARSLRLKPSVCFRSVVSWVVKFMCALPFFIRDKNLA